MSAKFSIPDHMPVLSPGNHRPDGINGACIMEFVSVLAGEHWSDHPDTVHAGLGHVARTLNDNIGDTVFLQGLAPLAPRFIGTAKYDTKPSDLWISSDFMFHSEATGFDTQFTAWTINRIIGFLPESMRPPVQRLITHILEGHNAQTHALTYCAFDAMRPAEYPSMSPVNRSAYQLAKSYIEAVQNNGRAAMYNIASHAFFVLGEAEGKAAIVDMLTGWLDHFDALTGHTLTDTTPEPVEDDNNDEEATAPAGLTMNLGPFSISTFTKTLMDDIAKNMQLIA